ncbi:hypothetical protein C8R44DRAFT_76517 [Mycena epipterygia]|nr:hypothetical protein C8R44DRAFT_76517 [Mycena epipterygia]
MVKTSKVIYKPNSQSTEEFTVIVDSEAYQKWKQAPKSVPKDDDSSVVTRDQISLSDVVDSYNVFVSTQGAQGVLGEASRQQLATVFEAELEAGLDDFAKDKWKRDAALLIVLPIILDKGREQVTGGVASSAFTGSNPSRGPDNTR